MMLAPLLLVLIVSSSQAFVNQRVSFHFPSKTSPAAPKSSFVSVARLNNLALKGTNIPINYGPNSEASDSSDAVGESYDDRLDREMEMMMNRLFGSTGPCVEDCVLPKAIETESISALKPNPVGSLFRPLGNQVPILHTDDWLKTKKFFKDVYEAIAKAGLHSMLMSLFLSKKDYIWSPIYSAVSWFDKIDTYHFRYMIFLVEVYLKTVLNWNVDLKDSYTGVWYEWLRSYANGYR